MKVIGISPGVIGYAPADRLFASDELTKVTDRLSGRSEPREACWHNLRKIRGLVAWSALKSDSAQDAYRLLVASDLRDLRRGIKQRRSDYSCEVFRHRVGLIGERMDFRSVDFAYYGDLAGRASTDPKQVCELEQFGIAIHGCASPMTDIRGSVSSEAWASATQARIDAQTTIVAGLTPGSANHRVSTSVLLLLQDSLFVLSQTKKMVEAAREQALGGRA